MKKLLYFFAAAAALFAISSCGEKPEGTPSVPTQIEANFTNLTGNGVTLAEVNVLPVTASENGVELSLDFYSDKTYLPTGSFTVGTGVGNYQGKIKSEAVTADIKSGAITVAMAGDGDYTLTGTLRLDNEIGTIVKLNATGNLQYEIPTEYYYTLEKGADANVYKIFDLENHPIAVAAVVGAEEGTFEVAKETLVPASGDNGTWVNVPGYGIEAYLHGKVTVSTSFGKKTFVFEDNHKVSLANCELKSSITPKYEDPGLFSWGFFTYSTVKSPVVKDMYEITIKLFYRIPGANEGDPDTVGPEFLSTTILTAEEDLIATHIGQGGVAAVITTYAEYADYTPNDTFEGRIAPDGASYFFSHGVKTAFKPSAESGKFMVFNCQEVSPGYSAIICAPIDATYAGPADLLEVLVDANIYSCMGANM